MNGPQWGQDPGQQPPGPPSGQTASLYKPGFSYRAKSGQNFSGTGYTYLGSNGSNVVTTVQRESDGRYHVVEVAVS